MYNPTVNFFADCHVITVRLLVRPIRSTWVMMKVVMKKLHKLTDETKVAVRDLVRLFKYLDVGQSLILGVGLFCLGMGLYLHFKDMKRVLFFQQKKFDELLKKIIAKQIDPYSAAQELTDDFEKNL